MPRDQLIELVSRLMRGEGSDAESSRWMKILEANVPHPGISDLIFWPEEEMTAEQIVDTALAWREGMPTGLREDFP